LYDRQRPCLSLLGGGGGGNSNNSKISIVLLSIHGLPVHIFKPVPVDVAVCILLPESAEQTNDIAFVEISVADPDPYVFGPPGSGSGSFYHQAKIVEKTLIPTVL
jgi:hypothetical protein